MNAMQEAGSIGDGTRELGAAYPRAEEGFATAGVSLGAVARLHVPCSLRNCPPLVRRIVGGPRDSLRGLAVPAAARAIPSLARLLPVGHVTLVADDQVPRLPHVLPQP